LGQYCFGFNFNVRHKHLKYTTNGAAEVIQPHSPAEAPAPTHISKTTSAQLQLCTIAVSYILTTGGRGTTIVVAHQAQSHNMGGRLGRVLGRMRKTYFMQLWV